MEKQEEQSIIQENVNTPEPTVISRRQAELEAANERLQHTAQNFSLEWKSFLGYAMQIKQQRTTGEKDLEDLLLKAQDGLVLLRELHNRRDQQWKEVGERYGYQRQSITDDKNDGSSLQQVTKQPQWLQTLVTKLLLLNQEVAATAHCAVKRLQLTAIQDQLSPSLVKLRAEALETHHRLQHEVNSEKYVRVEDVNLLFQFDYMKHQQDVVLERFCIRLKWLPVSHRIHLRQRILALIHQQKVKNTPRPRNSKDQLHCPLFIISTPHFAAELEVLTQKYSLPVPDINDANTDEYHALRQGADEFLASVVSSFPPDDAINTDGSLEMGLETLVHTYTRNSRWELIQRGHLGNCEPGHGPIEDTLITLRNDHKIDSLLANEWELLSLNDIGYLRVRLEALSRAHINRAKVDVEKSAAEDVGILENQHQLEQTTAEVADDDDENDLKRKSGLPNSWDPDALYSLYVLRVSACRAKRLSLLRLLNYLHFVQLCQVGLLHTTSSKSSSLKQKPPVALKYTEGDTINAWIVTKCEKTGDYIITRSLTNTVNDEDNDNNNEVREFIFAAAQHDLEVLELQMLRMASIFIFKQEYDSLPTSSRKRMNDRYGSDHDSDSVVTTIDRLQVLRDIYDCEVAFQQAKVQLVEKLLENGFQFTPRSQDLTEFGFSTSETQAEPFTDILLPLLQRRPYLDFSHAYFFESYAAETILLELQSSLIYQMEQHFERLEWCALQDFAFGDQNDSDNEKCQWICRQILGNRALIQLYSQQDELVREADEKWFTTTSIGAFHALQHALLEQMLVMWSLIIKLELPGRPMRCLERTAGDLLVGSGWQLVLPPQSLSDVCRTLHEQTNGSRTLVEYLARALELEDWRHKLAKNVYETHLLERIHQFQFDFVKQVTAFDAVVGGEHTRHLAFFFEFGECDRAKLLQPIAIELTTTSRSGDNKSISEWIHTQLSDDCSEGGNVATERRSLLQLQLEYLSYLRVNVTYQDAVGGEVFEFAASYPYVCLPKSFVPESSNSTDEKTMDLNTVRTKYAKEIADKMTEEMQTSCFPYWNRLEIFKQQLQERFVPAPNQDSEGLRERVSLLEVDMMACGRFLDEETYQPRLLTTLNNHLQRLRNEKKLMQQLSPATRTGSAFSTASDDQSDEDQPSGLTKWLMVKLHQLKVDLQIHERPKVEQLLLTPPASYSSSAHRLKRNVVESLSSDVQPLLQSIPSFRRLLLTFAMTSNFEKPRDSNGGVASAHATRLHEYREETLRTLVFFFHQFSCTLDLLRIRCGSRFATIKPNLLGSNQRYVKRATCDTGSTHSGLSRLERWQTRFHHEIRHLLDQLTNRLSPEMVIAAGDLFATHPEHLQSQHYASLLRQEICTALQEANIHSIRMLRFTSNFALLQTYHKNAALRVRKHRQHLTNFQTTLENITMEVTTPFNSQIHDSTAYNGKTPFADRMRHLVRTGEQAWFAEARPCERECEWQAFEDAVEKYEPRDCAYIEMVTHLLELHRVYIEESCRVALRLAEETSLALQRTAENQALVALDDLWDRFRLPTWDSLLDDEISVRSTAPVIGGENLDMKKRLLLGASSTPGTSASKELSYALRSLQMGNATALSQFCNTGLLVLPPPSSIEEQLVYLQLSVELTWVDADMKELEEQYKKFLLHRKTHRESHRASNFTPKSPRSASSATSSSLLLVLSKYFHEEGVPADKAQQPDTSNVAGSTLVRTPQQQEPAFIVPASKMAHFLHDVIKQCMEHNKQQLDLHNESIQQLQNQYQAADLDRQKLERQLTKARVEERIRREAFAVDHAFHLYFEVEALRKQLSVLEARRELDRQVLRCELNVEYEEKLQAMNVELLNKQQKFAEYRTTMQRELQSVIQGAHSQFVDQLLDYSGAIPSTTKSSVSHLLRGQQDIVRIKSENAAMKQALLKVRALGDMQQQTQTAARERELLLSQRFATAEALQRNEVEQLQAYVKQLEGNLSKLSQEKTYFQVKWTTAQNQIEATAQRRREAKVRALSANYNRKPATPGTAASDDDDFPAIWPSVRAVSDTVSDTASVMDVSSPRPQTAASIVDNSGKQEHQRLEAQYLNSARHFQNEIRRLQQQVTREIREKAAIAEQLTQLRQYEAAASIQPRDGLPFVDHLHTPRTPLMLPSTPRKTQSASPRATSRTNNCVATPPDRMTTPKRPNSSFSPRTSMLRTPGPQSPALSTPSSKPNTANTSSATPTRKFQVVKRETNAVGGVAGVSNSFSVREPLPYR